MDAASLVQKGVRGLGRAALGRVGSFGGRVRGAREARHAGTVGRPPDEVYAFWRDPQGLSRALGELGELSVTGPDRVRWRVRGRDGGTLEWDTQIVEDRPGELLRWRSVEGAAVTSEGGVELRPAPGGQGTEVTLHLRVDPPQGASPAMALAPLAVSVDVVVLRAVQRTRALIEVGEVPTLRGNPAGRGATAPGHVGEVAG